MKVKELIYFWIPFAVLVVIGRRVLRYGFNTNVFKSGFLNELFLGIVVFLIVIIILEKRK